ncbi:MAG: hypothetical protein AAF591_23690 [Verrucomicrobiota bacterium]
MNSFTISPQSPESPDNIIHLRHLLHEKFPLAHHQKPDPNATTTTTPHLPTKLPALDQLTHGGLPKGALTEITTPSPNTNSPATLLLTALLDPYSSNIPSQHPAASGYPNPTSIRQGQTQGARANSASGSRLCLVDGSDSFDPQSHHPHTLHRLLWVRCHTAADAVKAADLLLRDGNLPLILLDLLLNPLPELQRLPPSAWHRLRALAEKTGAALLAFTPSPKIIPNTRLRLTLTSSLTLDDLDHSRPQLLQTHIPKIKITRDQRHLTQKANTKKPAVAGAKSA